MKLFFLLCASAALTFAAEPGFQPIFNGKDLTGWHISEVNHHGNTKAWTVKDGVLMGTQNPPGNGGILLTDRKYKDFEITLEINPDFGCDGGLLLRSSEKGEAYQVMLDYLEGGNVGGIYGERIKTGQGRGNRADRERQKYWKKGEWNQLRARIEGEIPHIQVWLNGQQLVDWTDEANNVAGGATDGMIALQLHFSNDKTKRWVPGGYHRYRNIAVKELNK